MLVDRLVLRHDHVGVQRKACHLALCGLEFGEVHQRAADTCALRLRPHREVLDEQGVTGENQCDHPGHRISCYPERACLDHRGVVTQHGRWRPVHAGEVLLVGRADDLLNSGQVRRGRLPDNQRSNHACPPGLAWIRGSTTGFTRPEWTVRSVVGGKACVMAGRLTASKGNRHFNYPGQTGRRMAGVLTGPAANVNDAW
jgi:hypothetical protein